jgi:hypothetical protein
LTEENKETIQETQGGEPFEIIYETEDEVPMPEMLMKVDFKDRE